MEVVGRCLKAWWQKWKVSCMGKQDSIFLSEALDSGCEKDRLVDKEIIKSCLQVIIGSCD